MGAIFYQFSRSYEHKFVIYYQSTNKGDTELKSYCNSVGIVSCCVKLILCIYIDLEFH